MKTPHFRLERALLRNGVWPVAGVDEVGRGPLAGPVCAAAIVLDPARIPKGLNDSKALTAAARDALHAEVLAKALGVGIAFASAEEIDVLNIRQATFVAMRRALTALAIVPAYVLIDGNDLPPCLLCEGETLIKGDATSASIAAASIVAKVTRDRMMQRACDLYPGYGFAQHVGYATKLHLKAIAERGPCALHRMSFSPMRIAAEEAVSEQRLSLSEKDTRAMWSS